MSARSDCWASKCLCVARATPAITASPAAVGTTDTSASCQQVTSIMAIEPTSVNAAPTEAAKTSAAPLRTASVSLETRLSVSPTGCDSRYDSGSLRALPIRSTRILAAMRSDAVPIVRYCARPNARLPRYTAARIAEAAATQPMSSSAEDPSM